MMSERKLLTLRTVAEIKPIPKADRLEAARVDGWWTVVPKGQFHVGSVGVFFEIDSILPNKPQFQFLMDKGKEYAKGFGFRVKTIRLRGQLSQGLLLPLSEFPTLDLDIADVDAADKLAAELGIYKYEAPVPFGMEGMIAGPWPGWLPKTDQERVQNIEFGEEYYQVFIVEEKLDGTSMSIWVDEDGVLGVGSRNTSFKLDEGVNDNNLYVKAARESGVLEFLKQRYTHLKQAVAIQGELIGPKIQGNPLNRPKVEFHVFDVYIPEFGKLNPSERKIWTDYMDTYGCNVFAVPELGVWQPIYHGMVNIVDECLALACRKSALAPVPAEGVVFKAKNDGNLSFKAINNEYLLKDKS